MRVTKGHLLNTVDATTQLPLPRRVACRVLCSDTGNRLDEELLMYDIKEMNQGDMI